MSQRASDSEEELIEKQADLDQIEQNGDGANDEASLSEQSFEFADLEELTANVNAAQLGAPSSAEEDKLQYNATRHVVFKKSCQMDFFTDGGVGMT